MPNYFSQQELPILNGKLKPYTVGGKPESSLTKYPRVLYGKDEGQAEPLVPIYNRTVGPTKPYVYGSEKQELPHADSAGRMLESKPLPDYDPGLPVWTGWRPKRPRMTYRELGMKMPVPSPGPEYESGYNIPSEEDLILDAYSEATSPYDVVARGNYIPDPGRDYLIYDKGSAMAGLGYLGAITETEYNKLIAQAEKLEETAQTYAMAGNTQQAQVLKLQAQGLRDKAAREYTPPSEVATTITALSRNIAAVMQAKYGAKIEEYKAKQASLVGNPTGMTNPNYVTSGLFPGAPAVPSGIPWGTIAIVGGLAVAAIFVLPKVLK